MAKLLFETKDLCKFYRKGTTAEVRALHDVSLDIETGSFVALTGPSGSGKTTLLALMGALERPTRGQIHFGGQSLHDCSDIELARIRRRIGFVFQDFSLIPNLTAGENITYPLIPRGVPRAERLRRAREFSARFGIEHKLTTKAKDLSGGEQQRVAVARALAGQPDALLADEPTSNLDPETGQSLIAAFQELHAAGTTVILVSHDPAAISSATHVVELAAGRIENSDSDKTRIRE